MMCLNRNYFGCILVSLALVFFCNHSSAQQNNPLINSGELLKQGNQLHDEKKYKAAIEVYQKISRSDTNYADALYELSYSTYQDSQFLASHNYAQEGMRLYPEDFTRFALQDANALDDLNRRDEALTLYDEAFKRNPHSALILFNKGLALVRADRNAEAKQVFQQCLLINAYYSSAHYFLGSMYYEEGNMVAAMLAFKTYLLVAPNGKYQGYVVQKLSNIANVTDEVMGYVKKYKAAREDNFSFLQEILLSKVALDRQYKLKADLEDKIVRQMQVVDEKLEYNRNDKGFAMQYYAPLYVQTFSKDMFEPMVFVMFQGLDLKAVQSWLGRNKRKTQEFASSVVEYLNGIRNSRTLVFTDREKAPVFYLHNENGVFLGSGANNIVNGSLELKGVWQFFHDNGALSAKGSFNSKAAKEGWWEYYYTNGQLKQKTNYTNGEEDGVSEGWFENGNKWFTETNSRGKTDGTQTIYFYNGIIKTMATYKAGIQEGQQKNYHYRGILASMQAYSNGKKNGMGYDYHDNGALEAELNYKDDKGEGTYKGYYESGVLKQQGEFAGNLRQGLWTTYYEDGTVKEKTTYKDGEITGEFMEYHENGKLSSKGNYTKKKIDGMVEYFDDDGVKFSDATYDRGKLREINFYDKKGNNISNTTTRRGAADITFYTPQGIKQSQGYFNKDGEKEGKFYTYFASGKVSDETEYKQGQPDGTAVSYYNNGRKKLEHHFTNGEEDGYVKSYFYNGKLSYEAWVIKDMKQQHFIYYNYFGDVIQRSHYLNNELDGYTEYRYPGNVTDYEYKYHNGWLEKIIQYDSLGKVIETTELKKGNGTLNYKHQNGATASTGRYENYMLQGVYKTFYFDGSPSAVFFYHNDQRDSSYRDYFFGGAVKSEGAYKNGDKHGPWKYYYPNGKLREETTFKNGYITGLEKNYNEDGTIDKLINYKEGNFDGDFKIFGDNNQLAVLLVYKKGEVQGYSYEGKDGKLVTTIPLKGATGKVTAYYKNGTKSVEMEFSDNDVQGQRKLFYSNGKPYIEGTREFGYDNGVKKVYHLSGSIMKEENYVLGQLHGNRKTYYANGKPEKEEHYYNDDLHGTCRYYDAAGKLKETRVYYYGNLLSVK